MEQTFIWDEEFLPLFARKRWFPIALAVWITVCENTALSIGAPPWGAKGPHTKVYLFSLMIERNYEFYESKSFALYFFDDVCCFVFYKWKGQAKSISYFAPLLLPMLILLVCGK